MQDRALHDDTSYKKVLQLSFVFLINLQIFEDK